MKSLVVILVILTLASLWFAGFMVTPEGRTQGAPEVSSIPGTPGFSASTDVVEVFQRAFWKRPASQDQILHAERQQWTDRGGVNRWQWFIAVDPSKALSHYLLEQNPFSLSEPKGGVSLPKDSRPEWFPGSADGFTVRQSMDGQMLLLIQPSSGRWFAAGQGRGFARPVPDVSARPPAARLALPRRLPVTPPPMPDKP